MAATGEHMSVDFKHTVRIERPAHDVFAFVSAFENNPSWQQGMVACEWTSPTRGEVGATYKQQAQFLGKRIDTHFKVVAFVPNRSISIESTISTFPLQITRSVEAAGDEACEVTAHIRGQPTGWMKLFSKMVKKSVTKDYARLKDLLEAPRG